MLSINIDNHHLTFPSDSMPSCSPAYGMGLSERRVGIAIANHPRESILLQTKVSQRYHMARTRVEAGVYVHVDIVADAELLRSS